MHVLFHITDTAIKLQPIENVNFFLHPETGKHNI